MKRQSPVPENTSLLVFQDLPVDIQNRILSLNLTTLRQTPRLAKRFVPQLRKQLCDLGPTNDEIRRYLIEDKPNFFSYLFGTRQIYDVYTYTLVETGQDTPKWAKTRVIQRTTDTINIQKEPMNKRSLVVLDWYSKSTSDYTTQRTGIYRYL